MKRFLLSIFLLAPLAVFAESDFGVTVPEWKDFVPTAYIDIKEPKGLGKLNAIGIYWYERRIKFEAELENCKSMESNDERFACYEELKVNQFKENTKYNARMEARQNETNNAIPEMINPTANMLPVSNYINTYSQYIPNELR